MNDNLIEFVKKKIKTGSKILDLGAGDFEDVTELNKLGYICEGVDIKKGTDLEKPHISKQAHYDFVCSNFVLHFLKNKKTLLESAFINLKNDGVFFFQDLDKTDLTNNMYLTESEMKNMIEMVGFKVTNARKFNFFDDKPDHQHWHSIVEIHARK